MYRPRLIGIKEQLAKKSVLLLGPRRTGKSSLIAHELAGHKLYNLLHSDVFTQLSARPSRIREALTSDDKLVIIDEIQKLPVLLDEVHAMIEAFPIRFLLTGSSVRKLRKSHTSLMAGRAKSMRLLPFVSAELMSWDLQRVLLFGMVPGICFAEDPEDELRSYVSDYLREEIQAEALARRIEGFSRFLHRAALSNTELINFESIARDAQVPARTIREYYHILEDTLVGVMLEPLQTRGRRKAISKGKFYFFDVGVVNALTQTWVLPPGSPAFGRAFEQFIFQELFAYTLYKKGDLMLSFWRTTTHQEVDFVLDGRVAIEVKASEVINPHDLKGLQALAQEQHLTRRIVVCQESEPRKINGIDIWPYRFFLQALWGNVLVQ